MQKKKEYKHLCADPNSGNISHRCHCDFQFGNKHEKGTPKVSGNNSFEIWGSMMVNTVASQQESPAFRSTV